MSDIKLTKIVATIGPASRSEETLAALIASGLSVARVNFSHGTAEDNRAIIHSVRAAAHKASAHIAVMQDLCGPKIRIGDFETETVTLEKDRVIVLTTEKIVGTRERVWVNYEHLAHEVSVGNTVMLDDGKVVLRITHIENNEIHCVVVVGGAIRGRRGVNIPEAHLSLSSMTEKDWSDVVVGVEERVEYIALSFVRTPDDVHELRTYLNEKKSPAHIVVKVETLEAVDRLEEVIGAADAVMVARGDLSVELPMERVPLLQKRMIQTARALGKSVIVATQMMESMLSHPSPTRAEVSDVANAIFDGTDAVMTSNETAIGSYPSETIAMMSRIARTVEKEYPRTESVHSAPDQKDALIATIEDLVKNVGARAIVTLTETGATARSVARLRLPLPILALTPHEEVARSLQLSFGVVPRVLATPFTHIDDVFPALPHMVTEALSVTAGDVCVLVAGFPFGTAGSTNTIMVVKV